MIDNKLYSLIKVAETGSFTKASELLSMTQPSVSQHIRLLEAELGVKLFDRSNKELHITHEGEMVLKCARRMLSLDATLRRDLTSGRKQLTSLTIGITHTAESNSIAEALAQYVNDNSGVTLKLISDSLQGLYDKLINYELDFAIVEGRINDSQLKYLPLDTDSIVLAVAPDHRLASKTLVTVDDLKKEKLILRLPSSNTRNMFKASLESRSMSISDFNVIMEIDNIATIKDLIRRGLGVSVLPKSACMDELKKKKIALLPIENLSMIREISLVYQKDFDHDELLSRIVSNYKKVTALDM